MATITSTYTLAARRNEISTRDLSELIFGFLAIMTILWLPTRQQLIFGPIALLLPLMLVLLRPPSLHELGLSLRGFLSSLWMLPAAAALAAIGVLLARSVGTLHPLYNGDFLHAGGYVAWTIYQQFLLQDYFMPRLTRILNGNIAIMATGVLFAIAHLPNIPLAIATLVWGIVACVLFRRYRSLLVIGVVQGMLGLCFAVCIPDAMHHHMRVGLGYFHYHAVQGSF